MHSGGVSFGRVTVYADRTLRLDPALVQTNSRALDRCPGRALRHSRVLSIRRGDFDTPPPLEGKVTTGPLTPSPIRVYNFWGHGRRLLMHHWRRGRKLCSKPKEFPLRTLENKPSMSIRQAGEQPPLCLKVPQVSQKFAATPKQSSRPEETTLEHCFWP